MQLGRTFRQTFRQIKGNIKPLFGFGILFFIATLYLFPAFSRLLFFLSKSLKSVTYIGNDNIASYMLSFSTIILTIVFAIFLTMLLVFQVSAYAFAFHISQKGEKTTFTAMVRAGFQNCIRIFRLRNLPIILYVVLLLPMIQSMAVSNAQMAITLPEFISDFIFANKFLTVLYYALIVVLFVLSVKWCFSLHCYSLENIDFINGCKKSSLLNKKRFFRTVFSILIITVVYTAALLIISFVAVFLVTKGVGLFADIGQHGTLRNILINTLYTCGVLLLFFLPIISISVLSSLYYRYSEESGVDASFAKTEQANKPFTRRGTVAFLLIFVLLLGIKGFVDKNTLIHYINDNARPLVYAHRGESIKAPENTMPAFQLAIQEGADGVELDVHQTKDGMIIVSHDDNLSRVSGQDICVHEKTYNELMQLDVGSWFSKDFSYVRFSTLDEVLKVCKDKVSVQIELKPTEFDRDLEQGVLDIVAQNQMEDQVIILSLNAEALKKTKELNPNIITMYCMAIADGDVQELAFSDYFSIEASNITPELVSGIHKKGKKCFAWTVNNPDNVQTLIDSGIDGILTDDPVMLRKALDEADYLSGFRRYLRVSVL